ncbi:thrombospondin type-1 domain-containing protein 7A-like [Sycon ciliatum]|uniref:thrombospondin type-1 domain-containing protein 7A-like n=1 Tax=Sycon ciliatum TaxID=27933 RepID=UPI0031F706B9
MLHASAAGECVRCVQLERGGSPGAFISPVWSGGVNPRRRMAMTKACAGERSGSVLLLTALLHYLIAALIIDILSITPAQHGATGLTVELAAGLSARLAPSSTLALSALAAAAGSVSLAASSPSSTRRTCDGQHVKRRTVIDWETGNWSLCSASVDRSERLGCSITVSIRTRTVLCVQRTQVNATFQQRRILSDSTCSRIIDRPANWSLCNGPCYRHSPLDFQWVHHEWTKCSYLCHSTNKSNGSSDATKGGDAISKLRTQTRRVICQHRASASTVSDALCQAFASRQAPRRRRNCRFQDADCVDGRIPMCAYDGWSSWSPCAMLCGRERCRTRNRIPVTFPKDSAEICRDTLQMEKCEPSSGEELPPSGYVLRAGEWDRCMVDAEQVGLGPARDISIYQQPTIGIHQRTTVCMRSPDGTIVEHHHCRRQHPTVPGMNEPVRQLCIVPQDCQVTEWNSWKAVHRANAQLCILQQASSGNMRFVWPTHAIMQRVRRIKVQPFGAVQPCPQLLESAPVSMDLADEMGLPACHQLYEWFAGDWRSCVPSQDNGEDHIHCGRGTQIRAVFCQACNDSAHRPVEESLCAVGYMTGGVSLEKPAETQVCYKPCTANCRVSEWSTWSHCDMPSCGPKRKTAAGNQSRTRTVLTEPGEHGKPCPRLAENKECGYRECKHYVVDERRPCGLSNHDNPGGRWGCVSQTRWGVRPKKCRCSQKCPSWKKVRARNVWRSWSPCEPVGQRNSSSWRTLKYRSHQEEGLEHCPTEFETRPCRPSAEPRVFAWHAENFPRACRAAYRRAPLPIAMPIAALPACHVCERGVWYRPVYCVRLRPDGNIMRDPEDRRRHLIVHNERKCPATHLFKPHRKEICHICCQSTCEYSSWGDWGPCLPEACVSPKRMTLTRAVQCSRSAMCAASAAGDKSRSRYQLKASNGDSTTSACKDHSQAERCTLQTRLCYDWMVGNWSGCYYVSAAPCLGGFRTRYAYCQRSDGKPVTADHCAHKERPATAEPCRQHCDELCLFSSWSAWTACSESQCGTGHRTRTRYLLHNLEETLSVLAKPCGELQQTELCARSACREYKAKYSDWSAWLPRYDETGHCHHTEQNRIVRCFDKKVRRYLPLDYCPGRKKSMRVHTEDAPACRRHCELAPWQPWTSSCSQPCGHGWLRRTRTSYRNRASNGVQCPRDLVQVKPCIEKLCSGNTHSWHADPWAPCYPNHPSGNGGNEIVDLRCSGISTQSRHVLCLEHMENGEKPIVDDAHCAGLSKPRSNQTCRVTCPADCLWTQWTAWSKCEHNSKYRLRSTLRGALLGGRCDHSDIRQEKHCQRRSVGQYNVSIGPWTPCQRIHSDECGPAEQHRLVVCFDQKYRVVDATLCGEKAQGIRSTRTCQLPCYRNCQVSDWCSWSPCSQTQCDTAGIQRRRRYIVKRERGGAARCPPAAELVEERNCYSSKPCYHGKIYPWSGCLIDGADCGKGKRSRILTCRRSDGELVEPFKCFDDDLGPKQKLDKELMLILESEECQLPCPGECQYTPWSDWTMRCIANCNSNINTSAVYKGRRVAFRTIMTGPDLSHASCPERLWMTRQCKESFCMTFDWRTSPWAGTARRVWCQRSDGTLVTDEACKYKERPSATRCYPPCADNTVCANTTCMLLIEQGTVCAGPTCHNHNGAADNNGRERRQASIDQDSVVSQGHKQGPHAASIVIALSGLLISLTVATALLAVGIRVCKQAAQRHTVQRT